MGKYRIADFVIDIQHSFEYLKTQCAAYQAPEGTPADFTVCVRAEDMENERRLAGDAVSDGYLESVCVYRKICEELPLHGAMLLHGAAIAVDGKGIVFSARSGVGKTTHIKFWKALLGERLTVLNGDKPIVRFTSGQPIVCGTPWAGKENWHTDLSAPLTDLCFLERSTENRVTRLNTREALRPLMEQIVLPQQREKADATLCLIDALLTGCRLWKIECTASAEAAQTAIDTILS